jgi:ribosomal-protein-alanine N-acetyltransferase
VSTLEPLRAAHDQSVLRFETDNRGYFARLISDRGDDYFERFAEHHQALLADQSAGDCAFYLLVGADGTIEGRFNLWFEDDGVARLGYRVAESATGRGVATAGAREVCELAAIQHGIRTVKAAVSAGNVASQRVLEKVGFTRVGPAAADHLGGKAGFWYELDLTRIRGS